MYSLGRRSVSRIILDTLRMYISPVYKLKKSDLRLERIYQVQSGRRAAAIDAFSFSQKIATYNQGAIVEFVFVLADHHKNLRLALGRDDAAVGALVCDFISLMNAKFFEAIACNFEFLHDHFKDRSKITPRLSVKGNWRTEDADKIITIFRDRPVVYGDVSALEDNTAISYCARNGLPYLCNDIVHAVSEGQYSNPRIDRLLVHQIKAKSGWAGARAALERRWKDVWRGKSDDPSSYYRSTLVVPISIANNRLSEETLTKLNVGDADRIIFGYLCFDHAEVGFFDEDLDLPVAEMVSDILSIFAFQRLRFTNYSRTYRAAEQALRANCPMDDLRSSMSEVLNDVRSALKGRENQLDTGAGTTGVALLSTDELLLQLLEKSRDEGTAAAAGA